ncbi:MAG: hypothetical protein H6962_13655 [Chromatiaceae bacterium]|nr:hypothetical protein [Chromatiaceae bacterium]
MIVGDLLDRLGMLQRVRAQALADAAEFSFPVTNGREHLTYRVKVEGRETVNIGPRGAGLEGQFCRLPSEQAWRTGSGTPSGDNLVQRGTGAYTVTRGQ